MEAPDTDEEIERSSRLATIWEGADERVALVE